QLGNHLKARMKVTTYILHMASSSRALGLKQIEFTRDAQEAVVVMQSRRGRTVRDYSGSADLRAESPASGADTPLAE
ncbi:MAG TPA: hypothetical protein VGK01_24930, partial [Candidatus Angelobacter sp.]